MEKKIKPIVEEIPMERLKIDLHSLKGGTKKQRGYFMAAMIELEHALNSEAFKHAVIGYRWEDDNYIQIPHYKLNETKAHGKLSNAAIYELIMSGWDKFHQTKDNDVDVATTIYLKRFSRAVGYTYPSTFRNWINTKFWNDPKYEDLIAGIAANVAHEYMHNLDFKHAYKWNKTRKHTVPYAVGNIVYDIVKNQLSDRTFERKCTGFWRWKKCKWVEIKEV